MVRVLKAAHGDCILVSHEGSSGCFNVLIDGGPSINFSHGQRDRYSGPLRSLLDELKEKGQQIDLVILTHVDDDHINGLIRAFEKPGYLGQMAKAIWFNSSRLITNYFSVAEIPENNICLKSDSPQTSSKQGKKLEALLSEIGCKREALIFSGQTHKLGPFTFKILSPNLKQLEKLLHIWPAENEPGTTSAYKTDYDLSLSDIWAEDKFVSDPSIYNGSSIAFTMEAEGKTMLFLGDAHDGVVLDNLRAEGYSESNRLKVDLVKISHHGSQYNTSSDFLRLLDSSNFIITTDGSKHGLPNKRAIARIIKETSGTILFNYRNVISPLLLPHEIKDYSSRLRELDEEIQL